jgi:hypothetical protein
MLARLLSDHGLAGDIEPSPDAVQAAVLGEIGNFTDAFNEEFRTFSHLVARARYKDAVLTPFWGAVTDITWQHARKAARTSGSYRLVLEASDPLEPLIYLLADERGMALLARHLQSRRLPVPGKHEYVLELPGGSLPGPAMLARLGRDLGLDKIGPWRYLQAGCVPLFPDELGVLCSDGAYYEDAPSCFLLRAEYAPPVAKRAALYNLKHSIHDIGHGAWKVLLIESASRGSMRALADLLPGMLNSMPGLGWSRPRPRLSGGAWCGQALLLNPASNPVARMAGATGGLYELLAEGGGVLASGSLVPAADDGLQVPPGALGREGDIVAVRYVLGTGECGESPGELQAIVLAGVPSLPLAGLGDPGAWLADGRSGVMEPAFSLDGEGGYPVHDSTSTRANTCHPFLGTSLATGGVAVSRKVPATLPRNLAWLADALCLRFQSRSTLPTRDLMVHVEGVALASGYRPWHLWSLLHAGGWLARIARRTAPFALSAACPGMIGLARGGATPVARISGLLGDSQVARLLGLLEGGEQVSRLCCDEPGLSLGAIEVQLRDAGRLGVLAKALGLQVLDQRAHAAPLAGSVHARFASGIAMARLQEQAGLEAWDPREWKWVDKDASTTEAGPGSMFRYQRSQASSYWVMAQDGCWTTDSEAWARIFHVAAQGGPIGELSADGDCTFDRRIWLLPRSLVHWWLHRGGGCIAIDPAGRIVLCGARGEVDWSCLAGWLGQPRAPTRGGGAIDIAVARRALALKERLKDRLAPQRPWAR